VEVDRLEQIEPVLAAGGGTARVGTIMLDSFTSTTSARASRSSAGRATIEASGGVSLAP
jgi:nicotinate-nucleotide pyrophosphorylase (carboxylating)